MIASWTRSFIFIKTVKTASTSAEIVLSTWCSGDDICTLITLEDEKKRSALGGSARNFLTEDGFLYYNHMSASQIRGRLPELWRSAFKFAVERHPYEKVVSLAWFKIGSRRGDAEKELASEIDAAIDSRAYLNAPLYSIDGEVAVDEVIDYPVIWDRLSRLALELGTEMPITAPDAKTRFRRDRTPASLLLTDEQKARIYADAKLEFNLMNYDP